MVNLRVFDQITIYEFFRRFNIASERQLSFAYCDTRDRFGPICELQLEITLVLFGRVIWIP